MSIGKQISLYRKQMNITQEKLGELVGVSNQSVSKWESDVSSPDINLIPIIASTLNVSIEELFGCRKEENSQADIQQILPELVRKAVSEALETTLGTIISEIRDIKSAVDDIKVTMEDIESVALDASGCSAETMDSVEELQDKINEISEMLDAVALKNECEDAPSIRKNQKFC